MAAVHSVSTEGGSALLSGIAWAVLYHGLACVLTCPDPVCLPYRLTFHVADYQRTASECNAASGSDVRVYRAEPFFPEASVTFKAERGEHYHVPLTWSPFGYSTYRGS